VQNQLYQPVFGKCGDGCVEQRRFSRIAVQHLQAALVLAGLPDAGKRDGCRRYCSRIVFGAAQDGMGTRLQHSGVFVQNRDQPLSRPFAFFREQAGAVSGTVAARTACRRGRQRRGGERSASVLCAQGIARHGLHALAAAALLRGAGRVSAARGAAVRLRRNRRHRRQEQRQLPANLPPRQAQPRPPRPGWSSSLCARWPTPMSTS